MNEYESEMQAKEDSCVTSHGTKTNKDYRVGAIKELRTITSDTAPSKRSKWEGKGKKQR
jgi:hypothetical protein